MQRVVVVRSTIPVCSLPMSPSATWNTWKLLASDGPRRTAQHWAACELSHVWHAASPEVAGLNDVAGRRWRPLLIRVGAQKERFLASDAGVRLCVV